MKKTRKPTLSERVQRLQTDIAFLVNSNLELRSRIEALEKPRALTKQEILDAGGVVSLGGR